MTGIEDWRDIPCSDLDWFLVLHGRRASHALERQCREATGWIKEHRPAEAADRWHTMTLGQLADRGEVWWRQTGEGIGVVAIRCIKEMIDRAAAGYEVRKNRDNSNAYRPTPIDPPPDHLRRRP